jgi:hypothetical protein
MLAEFVQTIQEMAQRLLRPEVLSIPGQNSHLVSLAMPDGQVKTFPLEPPTRDHKPATISTLVELAAGYRNPCIWYNRHAVILIMDTDTRRDFAKLKLELSPQVKDVCKLEQSPNWMDQKALVRFLRVNLAGCIPASLLAVVRNLKFKINESGQADIQHGKSSIGKAIQSELTGQDSIPEEVTIVLPIFLGPWSFITGNVVCALEIDTLQSRFLLTPLPGSIESVLLAAEDRIGDQVNQCIADLNLEAPVYYGQP